MHPSPSHALPAVRDFAPGRSPRRPPPASLPEAPADHTAFWTARYEASRAIASRPRVLETTRASRITRVRIQYESVGGVRLGAWITTPGGGEIERAIVRLPGYGGLRSDDVVHPDIPDAAVLWLCPRGLGELGLVDGIPSAPREHVLHGIGSRETYVHGVNVQDVWCGISAFEELVPAARRGVDFWAASYGGGLVAMATPWDPRVRSAVLEVPSFGNHPQRVRTPCDGSGASVRRRWLEDPSVLRVLEYFDAATSARLMSVPTLVAPALRDPVVPPIGQWSIFDAVPAQVRSLFTLTAGHDAAAPPAERAELDDAIRRHLLQR